MFGVSFQPARWLFLRVVWLSASWCMYDGFIGYSWGNWGFLPHGLSSNSPGLFAWQLRVLRVANRKDPLYSVPFYFIYIFVYSVPISCCQSHIEQSKSDGQSQFKERQVDSIPSWEMWQLWPLLWATKENINNWPGDLFKQGERMRTGLKGL